MFARARAAHGQRAVNQSAIDRLHALHLCCIGTVTEQHHVEIAVANMADDRAIDVIGGKIGLRLRHTFSQPRNRYADIRGDGFFLEAHPKLRPVDTFVNGIFIAGCCQAPKDIQDTVSQASAAASRAATILSQDELEIDPLIAMVDEDICTGCGICVEVCPYEARTINERKRIAEVNDALCAGCGGCIAACPSNASIHKNFTKKQLLNQVDDIM